MPNYDYGSTCILTATPDECCVFSHWIDLRKPCHIYSTDNPLTVLVSESINFQAIFKPKIVTINVILNYPELGTTTGSGKYKCGEEVTITASTNMCNTIEWNDSALCQDSTTEESGSGCDTIKTIYCTITATEDITIQAEITPDFKNVCAISCPEDGGFAGVFQNLVMPFTNTFNGVPCLQQNNTIYDCLDVYCGQPVTLLAKPNKGYVFLGWLMSDDCDNCENAQTYLSEDDIYITTVCNNTNFIACFTEKYFFEINIDGCYDITIIYWLNDDVEHITYNGGFYINPGDVVHFTIQTSECCVLSNVLNNGEKILPDDGIFSVFNNEDTVIDVRTINRCHTITMVKTGCDDESIMQYKNSNVATFSNYSNPITVFSNDSYDFKIDYIQSTEECRLSHWNIYTTGLPVQVSHLQILTLPNIQRDYIIEAVMAPKF